MPYSINVSFGDPESRRLMTGIHSLSEVLCVNCGKYIGWKYVRWFLVPSKCVIEFTRVPLLLTRDVWSKYVMAYACFLSKIEASDLEQRYKEGCSLLVSESNKTHSCLILICMFFVLRIWRLRFLSRGLLTFVWAGAGPYQIGTLCRWSYTFPFCIHCVYRLAWARCARFECHPRALQRTYHIA